MAKMTNAKRQSHIRELMTQIIALHRGDGMATILMSENGYQVWTYGSSRARNLGDALNEIVHAGAFRLECGHLDEDAISDFIADREPDKDHIDIRDLEPVGNA